MENIPALQKKRKLEQMSESMIAEMKEDNGNYNFNHPKLPVTNNHNSHGIY